MTSPSHADGPFDVAWTASDAVSGVADVAIYVAVDGAEYTLWRRADGSGTDSFPASVDHTYSFAAVATDWAGNANLLPPAPHSVTSTVPLPQEPAPVTPPIDPIVPISPQPTPGTSPKVSQTVRPPAKTGKRGKTANWQRGVRRVYLWCGSRQLLVSARLLASRCVYSRPGSAN